MKRIIAIGLSPNTEIDDVLLTWKQMFMPWIYQQGSSISRLEAWFKNYFSIAHAIPFHNARSALYAILESLGIQKDDEIILQAFTCIVVPNAILSTGGTPVYADITSNLTLDPKDI